MITYMGGLLTRFLDGYVAQVVGQLTAVLVAIALIWLTVKIALYGFSVMRGEVGAPLEVFAWDMAKNTLLLVVALGGGFYMNNIFPLADSLQNGMAMTFVKAGAQFGASAPQTVFGALDTSFNASMDQVKLIWTEADITRLDLIWASILLALGSILFVGIGACVTFVSKVLLCFALAIGPIAILTLMFKTTAKFFDAWLAFVMSAVVLSWFVFFALGLSIYMSNEVMASLQGSDAFTEDGLVNAIEHAATYDMVVLILCVILWHAPSYAASLTGGPSVQSGGVLVSSAMTAVRMTAMNARSASSRGGSSAGGSVSNAPVRNATTKASNDPRPMHERVADAGAAKLEARRNNKEDA